MVATECVGLEQRPGVISSRNGFPLYQAPSTHHPCFFHLSTQSKLFPKTFSIVVGFLRLFIYNKDSIAKCKSG